MLLKQFIGSLGIRVLEVSILSYLLVNDPTVAQIIPDQTLPENSIVTPQGSLIEIDGGTQAGHNLFHSFEQFSVPDGKTAFFNNGIDIQNILSRVTGGSISEINGILKANGTANLFLINPNGIIFGKNAVLDLGGSFFATSADSIVFANGGEFNATQPNTPPLLTVNLPVGLWFRQTPRPIINYSRSTMIDQAESVDYPAAGLQVNPQQTLGLIGGTIILDGGILTASQGRIELSSVGKNSFVGLNSINHSFELNHQNVFNFNDIQIKNGAKIDVQGEGGGDIKIQGRRVTLADKSVIEANTLGSESGGTVAITAQDAIDIINSQIRVNVGAEENTQATGNGGDVRLNTQRLRLRQGGFIALTTYGLGSGGDLTIQAPDIEIIGRDLTAKERGQQSGLFAEVFQEGTGNTDDRQGGNINVITERLSIRAEQVLDLNQANPPEISASSRGIGKAGNINIQASESIEVINGAIRVDVGQGDDDIGNSGDILIETGRFLITEGSFISATTLGQGNAGDITITATEIELNNPTGIQRAGILAQVNKQAEGNAGNLTINTNRLTVRDGELISVANENIGNAGTLTINAREIELVGQASPTTRSENLEPSELRVGLFLKGENTEVPERTGGNLILNTERLTLKAGAQISGLTEGDGDGGNLQIRASEINLQDNSGITARAEQDSTGGNIVIHTDALLLQDQSRITANAVVGQGGNITINTEIIFVDSRSQITATSALGIDGTVTFNTPVIDPSSGLIELPNVPLDVSSLIGQDPCSQTHESEFVNTGRGGLPPSPEESLRSEEILVELMEVNSAENIDALNSTSPRQESNQPISSLDIVPARGWIKDENGDVILVSYDPTQSGIKRPLQPRMQCQPQ